MALDATKLFNNEIPFEMKLNGKVNGQEFTIEGKGLGSSKVGSVNGKWVCTSGKCPISWPALGPTLGYGFKVFTNVPNGIPHWYQQTMPEGYTMERTFDWENDGNFKAYHEVSYHNGVVFNNVTLEAEGFRADSPVLNDGLKVMLNSIERIVPTANGCQTASMHFYPLKGKENEYAQCKMMTIHNQLNPKKEVSKPHAYFCRTQQKHMRDNEDDSDHVIQHEYLKGHDYVF